MPRFNDDTHDEFQDDDDVYQELDESFDADADDDDDDEPTRICANCGFEMLEIVYQCPRCGEIWSREFQKYPTQPRWVILTALMLLGALLWWMLIH